MSRFFAFAVYFGGAGALGVLGVVACGSADLEPAPAAVDAGGNLRRDSALVDPAEAGAPVDATPPAEASCEKYCDLVMTNCTGTSAQYASKDECLAFCGHLPLQAETQGGDEKSSATIACRQYWADSPSQTSPERYCLAAGPFGGNTCGDRCTAFCSAVLSICPPEGKKKTPYADQPQCASACADFSYRDAGTDGGGEGPAAPAARDSLNCRLHQIRAAVTQPAKCAEVSAVSETCRD